MFLPFSIFNTRVPNNTKESSVTVHKTVASCKSAVPNEIGNKATFPPTDTKSTPPQVKLVLLVAPSVTVFGRIGYS